MRAKNTGNGSAKKIKSANQSSDSVTELLNEQLIQVQLTSQINKKNKKKQLLNEIGGNQEAHATAELVAPQGQDQAEQEKEGAVLVQSDGNSSANFGSSVSVSEADEGLVMSKRFAAIIPWLGGAAAIGGIAGLASGGGGSSAASDMTPPAAPVAAVATASDTGSIHTDGITNNTKPTITGTSEAGSTITVVMPGTGETITTIAAANGTWSVTPTIALVDGTTGNAIVTAKDAAGNTSTATNVAITIDTGLPATVATTPSGNEDSGSISIPLTATDTGSGVESISVVTLPLASEGVIYLADGVTAIAAGQELTPAQATGLIFKPSSNFSGAVVVPFTTTDVAGNVSPSNNLN